MSTNKPIIVLVHLDPFPVELPLGSALQQAIESNCVIKTATAEISFFNSSHIVQIVFKGLMLE